MPRRNIDVIIVDDQRLLADTLASVLERRENIRVTGVAYTAAAARKMALAVHPDVLVIDYRLPDGTGAAVARHLFECNEKVKTVVVTAYDEDEVAADVINSACFALLPKGSCGVDDIEQAIRSVHAGNLLLPARFFHLRRTTPTAGTLPRGLTAREMSVLILLGQGLKPREIGATLNIQVHTARHHVQSVIHKFDVHSQLAAVTLALREGILTAQHLGGSFTAA